MLTERDKKFIIKLKNEGYTREQTLELLNKDRENRGFPPISLGKNNGKQTTEEYIRSKAVNNPEKGFDVMGAIGSGIKGLYKGASSIDRGIHNIEGGAVAQVPTIAGNVAGGLVNIGGDVAQKIGGLFGVDITDEQKNKLGNWFSSIGKEGTNKLLDILGVDKNNLTTKTGKFGAEAVSMFIPGTNITKGGRLIKGASTGLKAELVSEGEITPEGAIVGAATEGVLGAGGKILNKYLPKDVKEIEKNLSLKGLVKLSSKGGKSTAKLKQEYNKALEGGKEIVKLNPTFKIKKKDDALSEVGDLITNTKNKLFNEMKNIRQTSGGPSLVKKGENDILIDTKDILPKIKELTKDPQFKTLLEEGGGKKEYERLTKLLFDKKNINGKEVYVSKKLSIDELYEKIKFLNKSVGQFLSSADNTKAQVGSSFAKIYNDVLDSKLGSLGKEYKKIKNSYSNIRAFEDGIAKELKKALNKNGGNILQNFGDAHLDSQILFNLNNPAVALQAAMTKVLKNTFGKETNPNYLLDEFIKNTRIVHGFDTHKITQSTEKKIREGIKKTTTLGIEKITK